MDKLKNGMILGGILGLALTVPIITAKIADFLAETIPTTWQIAGSWSIPLYGILVGVIVGYIVDKR